MDKSSTYLTQKEVLEIVDYLDLGEAHDILATSYRTSKKTISRINTGESWGHLTGRVKEVQKPEEATKIVGARIAEAIIPPGVIYALPKTHLDFIDKVVGVKNTFCLSFNTPINWGWYESWDGLHAVAGDATILWESEDLLKFALEIAHYDAPAELPVEKGMELPTFGLADLLTNPIEGQYRKYNELGEISYLRADNDKVAIRTRYYNLAERHKLEVRRAGENSNFVYFTKAAKKNLADTASIVIACVATLRSKNGTTD